MYTAIWLGNSVHCFRHDTKCALALSHAAGAGAVAVAAHICASVFSQVQMIGSWRSCIL